MASKEQKFKKIDEELILKIINKKKSGKSYGYLSKKYMGTRRVKKFYILIPDGLLI